MKCNNCKAFIPDKSVFCPYCGRKTPKKITQITLYGKNIIVITVISLVILFGLITIILQGQREVSVSKSYMVDFPEAEISLEVGDEYPLCIITESTHTNAEYMFVSSDESVVSVSGTTLLAKSAGAAAVSVVCGDRCCNRCLVTVTDIQPTEFSLNSTLQNNLVAKVGRPFDPPFVFLPDNTTDRSVNYLISNPEIAAVQDGHIVGLKSGTVTVYAIHKSTNLSTTFRISFEPVAPEEIHINTPSIMYVGDTAMLTCSFVPSDTTDKTILWSTDSDCVSISGELMTAKKKGAAVITASASGGLQASIVVQIF